MAVDDHKPIAPSLLSDPAFSADPHAHPYAVTSHEPWLSPPAGHPSLKSKSHRRQRPLRDTAESDTERFPIIPPPNSPVNFAASPAFAIPRDGPTPHTQAALITRSNPKPNPALSPSPEPRRRRTTFMTFLKRRSRQRPQSSGSVNSKSQKASPLSNENDVSPSSPRHSTESDPVNGRPIRPVTLGTIPPSASTSRTPQRRATEMPTSRIKDLDRIDELDETNPWGIALHHGGPYEAAVQAIQRKENKIYAGHGSYHRGVPLSQDKNYSPPQATGSSLNLSPGQILPRYFYPHHTTPSQAPPHQFPPTAVMMRPPGPAQTSYPQSRHLPPVQKSATLHVSSRPQSYQPPSSMSSRDTLSRRQSYDPPLIPSPVAPPASSFAVPQPQARLAPPAAPLPNIPRSLSEAFRSSPNQETEDSVRRSHMSSIGIGMAMLKADSDDEEAVPCFSHPSGLSTPAQARPPSLPPPLKIERPRKASPSDRHIPEKSLIAASSPSSSGQPISQPSRPNPGDPVNIPSDNPPPYTSPIKELPHTEPRFLQIYAWPPPSTNSSSGTNPSSVSNEDVPQLHVHVSTGAEAMVPLPMAQPPLVHNQTRRPEVLSTKHLSVGRSPDHVAFEDSSSVHPSMSTRSSSSSRSTGPPLSRRMPKHLVMPTPLAQPNLVSQPLQTTPDPMMQHQRPSRQRPPRPNPGPPPVLSPILPEPLQRAQTYVKAKAQEMHFAPQKAGKLKKRVSLISSGPPLDNPSLVTTVSFAPPIIDFGSVSKEDNLRQVMTENLGTKRVLSKRKSRW